MIKFRCRKKIFSWEKKMYKEWIEYVMWYRDDILAQENWLADLFCTSFTNPMQRTWLQDKYWTDIYELDIIKNWLMWYWEVRRCKWWYELIWLDYEYKWQSRHMYYLNSECLVIGNTYEIDKKRYTFL